jgi:asparagine synthase (glutamine-hydrolysing)
MTSLDGQLTIVFNGEIYNYLELRVELESKGYKFRSTGDTEVLLNAYREWGDQCLSRLNGMWAFLVYDHHSGTVFGSRDRFGIKPLFIHRSKDIILLASEIKAIRASGLYKTSIDWSTAADFLLRQRLDESERSFFINIEQIPPGSAFRIDRDGTFKCWQYWTLDDAREVGLAGDPIHHFADIFEDAVRLRMRSDVPVGVFLSGGLDSTSIICSVARQRAESQSSVGQHLRAFAYMDPDFDEELYINDTISQTSASLERLEYGSRDVWEDLPKIMWHHDQPVHSITALVGYRLSKAAAAQGVKVILNGQGADETLAGYPSYFSAYWRTLLMTRGPVFLFRQLKDHEQATGRTPYADFARTFLRLFSSQLYRVRPYARYRDERGRKKLRSHRWFASELADVLPARHAELSPSGDLDHALRRSVETSPLPLYLRVEDRNSMAHSIEIRVPFLDYRLVSLAFSLTAEEKMNGPYNKYVLRRSMKNRIPESVRTRQDKMGFPVRSAQWISELKAEVRDVIHSQLFRELGIFNIKAIESDFEAHLAGKISVAGRIFDVVQFAVWLNSIGMANSDLVISPETVG